MWVAGSCRTSRQLSLFSQTEKVRSLHLDVPQAAELRDELVKAGIDLPEGIIDTGECAQALYELLQ